MCCCAQVSGEHEKHGPQTPEALPSETMQLSPAQQSALVVQVPQAPSQLVLLQMYGGVPPGLGTHGSPLQQSALEAHDWPAPTQAANVQRGTPTLSCLQVSAELQFPEQQLHDALHEVPASLHTSPLGLQPCGLRQVPSRSPGEANWQVTSLFVFGLAPATPAAPQQSALRVHVSPTTWHPLADWQM
jgi:hypothetical protein